MITLLVGSGVQEEEIFDYDDEEEGGDGEDTGEEEESEDSKNESFNYD